MTERATLLQVLSRVAPGTALRTALERIIQHGNGALVVIGSGPEIESVSSGGFTLRDAEFTPARLAELAKMDGAIILDDAGTRILRANVHLLPDPAISTDETGARFRTSERMARMTDRPVLAVSEERGQGILFYGDRKQLLRDPSELLVRINQELQTLERFRRRLSEAAEGLTRLEVNEQATLGDAMTVLQRTELVCRIGDRVRRLAVGLGDEGRMVDLQRADLVVGVKELRELVARDYLHENGDRVADTLQGLEMRPLRDLYDTGRLCRVLGLKHAGTKARPMGYRLVSGAPGLPASAREGLVEYFRDANKILVASLADLSRVSGVGRARALRRYLDQIERRYRYADSEC